MKRRIRTTATIQERAKELRNRQLGGFKFRRPAPMDRVIADFYCAERKLIIEIDGDIHAPVNGRRVGDEG